MTDPTAKEPDIHVKTAAQIFDKKPEDVTPEERHFGKMVNFSVSLGRSVSVEAVEKHLLKQGLGVEALKKQAVEIVERWKAAYPAQHETTTRKAPDVDPDDQDYLHDDEKALDALYSAVDTLLSAGRFSMVNALLKGWDCDVEGVELTIGLLTMVADKPPSPFGGRIFTKDELPFRESFHVIAARYIHSELCSEAPETLQNLVPENLQYLNDKPLPCKTCDATTPHRFRPSPEAGPYWRCSECGNKTCVTPNGRTDGHGSYGTTDGDGTFVCSFCKEPL